MGLSKGVAVKLDAYTLFCRQLLTHLLALNDATRTDTRLTSNDCLSRFDQSLHQFFKEAAPLDLKQAANELGALLRGRVALFRAQNPQAASVFDRVIEAAKEAAPAWHHQDDLEAFHRQGRELARCFYADSPWPVTQARLDREVQLVFGDEEPERREEENFGYRPTPLAFRERESVIVVRFGFGYDFGLYLAYPFLFMHEYVSHIFALDYHNERFNDGWLLYAANAFLRHYGWNLDLQPPLVREQIRAFERLYGKLTSVPRQACDFTRDFDDWLDDTQRFQAMTWELAAFKPRPGESDFWPDQFINRLGQEFDYNRPLLRRKIEAAPNVRPLYEMLPPV